MLKTVYFDLGNVLFFFNNAKMFAQIATCCGISTEEVKKILYEHKIQEAYEAGKINSEDAYQIFRRHAKKPFSLCEFLDAASDIFTPNLELWPIVETLKREGHRLILISNTCECHFNRVYSNYPILKLFHKKILSYEVGALKPDARIFHRALASAECSPDECFYTDDIPEFVAGARLAGLDSELFTDVPTLRKHLENRGFKETL